MKTATLIILLSISMTKIYSQSNSFIDSLKADSSSSIIVFEDNCIGCIVMNSPCEEYPNSGNPQDRYVIWKNDQVIYIKRFNVCGSSNTLTIKKWKNNPFDFIDVNSNKLDTTKLLYPLSLDRQDSTWFETGINHYKYYNFTFVTYEIQDLLIKDYAFREPKKDDDAWAKIDTEFARNQSRYNHNNESAIKELLDVVQGLLTKEKKNLEITNANTQ